MIADVSETQLIMVSYFRPNDLRICLTSVLSNTPQPFRLSIIDNSMGGLDEVFKEFDDPRITVCRNAKNLGKGRAIMKWYDLIMGRRNDQHFVSIDSDLRVPPDWLPMMQTAALRAPKPLGMLAPTIINESGDDFERQLKHGLVMHARNHASKWVNGIYQNRHTAGPLFLIDRKFFDSVGGYVQTQLYGNDDGELCKAAAKAKRFIGIVPEVKVLHLTGDETPEYRDWKRRNVNRDADHKGHWG